MATNIIEIRKILDKALADPKVYLFGEDVEDPYGGCFKVTRGLSTKYPGKVFNTPISEAGIMGLATGLAIRGFRPIVEIMFYDFMTLCMDQILNHAVKFQKHWDLELNITIRTVVGKKSLGFQHSQNLDFIFKHIIPVLHMGEDSLETALTMNEPKLFVEVSEKYMEES